MPRRKIISVPDSGNDTSQPGPEDLEQDVMETAHKIMRDTKNIRKNKRKAIEEDFQTRKKELKAKFENKFKLREATVIKLQDDVWVRLETLNEKRRLVEDSIISGTKMLESAILDMTSKMNNILNDSIHNHNKNVLPQMET
ncbi:hypothetical protein GcM1_246155 [Golovinomyces cichoracearum]|uniref:Uncharacterized protein n=1 Tax=Golovinomyces cichoracearum TaxID=62708 RepID=A0A420IEJ8_9PEZI|nr:hypothetical protein GcM1_246155 [Golovinomyces cichoracearum]